MTRYPFLLLALLSLCGCAPDAEPPEENLSVILAGGFVYSGNDAEAVITDVGISDNRVTVIGDLKEHKADLRLDVTGLAVVPGFVDIHSHAVRDEPGDGIFRWPDAENLIRQGVTTVVGGPDGGSPLPIVDTFIAIEANPASISGRWLLAKMTGRQRKKNLRKCVVRSKRRCNKVHSAFHPA